MIPAPNLAKSCLETTLDELRLAVRRLRRARAFTLSAIAVLAVAIGLNVTTFAVMHTMVFGGFPLVQRNDRLVYIQEHGPGRACCISFADFEDWRAEARSFEGMAFVSGKQVTIAEGAADRVERIHAVPVTSNAFALLGVAPALGRDFAAGDEAAGAPRVAILSHAYWQNRFGGRADIVGHTVRVNDEVATIVGVMPRGFDFPETTALWVPLERTPALLSRNASPYLAFGRLKDGATVAGARSEIETIGRRLAAEYPATNRDVLPKVSTHAEFFIGPDARVIYGSLWAASWFVLLIACANLANLTLARSVGRGLDFSTRIALGAGEWRLMRQLLAESLLLAAAGGMLAWWLASASTRLWAAATASRYQILDYTLGAGTLGYVAAVSLAAAAMFGVVPMLRLRRLDANRTLRVGAFGATADRAGKRIAAALVAGQMALAVVLLSGTGVLVRSFQKVVTAQVGVRAPGNVLIGSVGAPDERYASVDQRLELFMRLRTRLAAINGVESAAIASVAPVNNTGTLRFDVDGALEAGAPAQSVVTMVSGPGYFHTVGSSLFAGRDFTDADRPQTAPVAIVNQSFAARHWPDADPVGKRLRLYEDDMPGQWLTVVGVAANIMQGDPTRQRFLPIVYRPFGQAPAANATLFVRAHGPAAALAAAVRGEVLAVDPGLTLENVDTLARSFAFRADRMDIEHVEIGKYAAVSPLLAAIALFLAAVGLYAVVAHSVAQRTREIGIRMAVGASFGSIRALVLRDGMRPVALGLAAGLAASLGVNRVLESQLVGVSTYDPATLAAAAVTLVLVALAGCYLPARRAMGVNPVIALRDA